MADVLDIKDAGRILSVTHTDTSEQTSAVIRASRGSIALVLYVFSTVAGTIIVDYIDARGTARAMTAALAVAANTLSVITFDHFVPTARCRYTPSSSAGSPTTVVDGYTV